MFFLRGAALVFFIALTVPAHAMTFHASPPILYLGGTVVATDWDAWLEAMTRFGGGPDGAITTIVFHQSGGGDSRAGRLIGNNIRKRKLNTVVYGRCASACANMFLGGITRQFAATPAHAAKVEATFLGFHGSYNKATKTLNTKRSGDYFLAMSDGKMSEEFVEKFIRLENEKGLLRFMHPDHDPYPHPHQAVLQKTPLALLCKGNELPAKRVEQCEHLDGVDALTQGVVTTWDEAAIVPPPPPSNDKVTVKSWNHE